MNSGESTSEKPNMLVPEDEYWRGVRSTYQWDMITPDINEIWEVTTFDDGNSRMSRVPNCWIIYGSWKDKVAIINTHNPNTRIPSISLWKLSRKNATL
tara:strand:- start:2 stop:295 length:294 start_codon:yes stop_codon:yes gene_type:complete